MPIEQVVTGEEQIEINGSLLPPVTNDDTIINDPIRDGEHRYNASLSRPEFGRGGEWVPYGAGSGTIIDKNAGAIVSTDISKSMLNDTYPDAPEDSIVMFTNLTDIPDNIVVVQKYDFDNQDWSILSYLNKLA